MSDDAKLSEQPFISHLIELRDRLIRMVGAVVVLLLILMALFITVLLAAGVASILHAAGTGIADQR